MGVSSTDICVPDAKRFFKGGEFCLPMDTGHLAFAYEIFSAAGDDVAVVLPTYNLAPDAPYPRQLTQRVGIVRHLLEELEKKPSNIILGGDSVGL
jgi:acetyl esterase/lipase